MRGGWDEQAFPLSVVVITPAGFGAVADLLDAVADQTIAARLEVLVVGPPPVGEGEPPASCEGFGAVRQVVIDAFDPLTARFAGIAAASAPVVALTEDHALPEPGWAEALLAAYDGDPTPAAVGPMMVNANPASALSCANFLLEYGDWCLPSQGGARAHLPGHNSSYRRSFLLGLDDMEEFFDAETVGHWAATDAGALLVCDPGARLRHLNYEVLGSSLHLRYKAGRVFGGYRARAWGPGRRCAYALAAPLVAAVRLRRLLPINRAVHPRSARGTWAALVALTVAASLGEAVGAVAGPGETRRWNADVAVDRKRFVRAGSAA